MEKVSAVALAPPFTFFVFGIILEAWKPLLRVSTTRFWTDTLFPVF
jgi:hypothetical protein